MKTVVLHFTREDVETLQNTVEKLPKGTYSHNPEYEPFKYLLTDNESPLDLFLLAHDLWTYNEYEENNLDYISEQENYIENNLDYKKAFLSTLSEEQKAFYRENIEQYEDDFWTFEEKQKELIRDGEALQILQEEKEKDLTEFYRDTYKTFLNGDYRDGGALDALKHKGDYEAVEYDEEKDILTLEKELEEDEESETPEALKMQELRYCKRRICEFIDKRKAEQEKRKKEREAMKTRQEEHEKWRIEQLKKELA